MKVLIGNTGLVGQTLQEGIKFDLMFNSSNIETIKQYDLNNSEIYLACLPATKWKVNLDILKDFENLYKIFDYIKPFIYKKIVLISTIDVYTECNNGVTEEDTPTFSKLHYGSNRFLFELLIKELNCDNIQVYRLPALFSKRIKKNILYDLFTDNNLDKIDKNSAYQWYNLDNLIKNIQQINTSGAYNLFPEPIPTSKIIELFSKKIETTPHTPLSVYYNYKTIHTTSGYIESSEVVLNEIKKLVDEFRDKPFGI
jgi:hypothetical protein